MDRPDGNDIVAIYTDNVDKPKLVTAILLDGKKGSRIREVKILSLDARSIFFVQNDPAGNFKDLLVIDGKRKEIGGTAVTLKSDLTVASEAASSRTCRL